METRPFKVVVDSRLDVVHRCSVNFDEELPHYRTVNGMHSAEDGSGRVTSPVAMWLEALDSVLAKLAAARVLSEVDAVSFSGQQHGSVYWTSAAEKCLSTGRAPDAADSSRITGFREALWPHAFATPDSPIWADASTGAQCEAFEYAMGGAGEVAAATGSRAYARFTAHQIAAIAERAPQVWAQTSRVSLVSSFVASLFAGEFVAVDASDATGANPGPPPDILRDTVLPWGLTLMRVPVSLLSFSFET